MANYKSTFVPRLVRRFCQELSYDVFPIERVIWINTPFFSAKSSPSRIASTPLSTDPNHAPPPIPQALKPKSKLLGVVIPSGACPKAELFLLLCYTNASPES
jgi:hypothetical protein